MGYFGAGSSVDRGRTYLTLAQATLCSRHKEKAELTKEGTCSAKSCNCCPLVLFPGHSQVFLCLCSKNLAGSCL